MISRANHRTDGGWTRLDAVAAFVLVALGVFATWDSWKDIASIATRDEEQSHILLVPIIAGWLVWMRRGRLRHCARERRWIGPAVVAIGWALYSIGDARFVQVAWHLGAVAVAVGCFLSIAGLSYLPRLLPAFLVLAFLAPVPGTIRDVVSLPLQEATAEATRRTLSLFDVDVLRTGNALVINGREVVVAEACNGLRMVFALLLVSFAFAYSTPIREPVRWLIVALSPLTALVCNVIRLVPSVWVYGYVSEAAGARMHAIGAWVMLPVAFLLLLAAFRTLRWALVPVYRYTLAYGK